MIGFLDLLAGFSYQIFESERDFFAFDEKLFEMHEVEENQHSHPYIVLAIFFEFFQCFEIIIFSIFFVQDFSFGS